MQIEKIFSTYSCFFVGLICENRETKDSTGKKLF